MCMLLFSSIAHDTKSAATFTNTVQATLLSQTVSSLSDLLLNCMFCSQQESENA